MKNSVLIYIFLVFLASVPYLNTLEGSFIYDDIDMVVENKNVAGKTTLYQMFFDKQTMTFSGEIYRPLRDVFYRIDYMIGGKEPFVYHASNIFLHVTTSLAAYWFLALLFKNGPVPLLAAAIFAVHPLHTESVAWVKGRDDILFTLFYLLSFGAYLKHEGISGLSSRFYLLASIFLFILSLFSKELAVTLPLAIALYQVIIRKIKFYPLIPFFVVSAIYIALRTYILEQVAQQEGYWGDSFFATMLTMSKGIVQYIRLSFLPINQCADYLFPLSTGIDYEVLLSIFFLSSGTALLFYWGNRYVLWGGLFFVVSLMPVMNIIPIKIIIAERFLYLPLLGLSIIIASGLNTIFTSGKRFWVVSGLIVCSFAVLTFQRNYVWSDEYSLWSDTLKKYPSNPRARYSLGSAYASKNMMYEAEQEYRKSIEIAPYYPYAFYGLGLIYDKKGMFKEAEVLYKTALKNDPAYRNARYSLAVLYYEHGMIEEAADEYEEVLERNPEDYDAINGLGAVYVKKGLLEEALMQYEKALNIEQESGTAYINVGMVYALKGRMVEAENWFKKALEKDPDSAEAYYNIGFLYQNMGRMKNAVDAYKMAIDINPAYKKAGNKSKDLMRQPSVQ